MHVVEAFQGRQQFLGDRLTDRDVNGGREHVVGGLAHVDVVVGVDRLFLVEAIAAGQLDGPIADDLVGVHVRRGAGARLVNINGKLVVVFAGGDLARGQDDGLSEGGREFAEIAVGDGGGDLDQAEGVDQAARQRLAGNGEIVHGTLRLGAVVSLGRDIYVAHGIVFGAELAHGCFS